MAKNTLSILELEIADEWIYYTVISNYDLEESIDLALRSIFSEEPLIREEDITDSIETILEQWKYSYDNDEITKEEYEKLSLESSDRLLAKQELIEVAQELVLQDGLAASELLTALLGKPTTAFKKVLTFYGEQFSKSFEKRRETCQPSRLISLIPDALQVIEKLKKPSSLRELGIIEQPDVVISWFESIKYLEGELKSQFDLKGTLDLKGTFPFN